MNARAVTLADVAEVFNGKTPAKVDQRETGHPVLKIRDVDENGAFRGPFESFVDPAFAMAFSSKRLRSGDSLILNAAHNADYVGSKTFFAGSALGGALVTGEWLVIRPRLDVVDPRYVHYWLGFAPTRRFIRRAVKGIHLYPGDVANFEFSLPPLPEQRRIADILDKADAIRRKRKEAIALTEELLRSGFLEMFGDPVTNPKGWVRAKVGDLLLETRSGATVRPEDFRGAGFPVLHKGGIKPCGKVAVDAARNTFVDESFARSNESSIVDRKFVVVTLRDLVPTGPSIGLASSLEFAGQDEYLLVERVYGVVLDRTRILPEYFVWLSNDRRFRRLLANMAVGATQVHIRRADYNELSIPVPPIDVQDRFRRIAHHVATVAGRLELAATADEALTDSLVNGAFRGDLSPSARKFGAPRAATRGRP